MSQIQGNPQKIPFNWSRNSQGGLFVATTGKSSPNFSSPVLARPSFPFLFFCFQIGVFTRPIFLFPLRVPAHQSFSPLGVLALPNLSFQIAVLARSFPFAVFQCALFAPFLLKFLGARFASFSLGVFAPLISHFSCVFTPALISPLPLVFPRAWVSLPCGVPVCPNLSFTVSIPARRIQPFSLRVLAYPNFSFPLGDFPFPSFVLVRTLFSFLLLGAFLPRVFPCQIFPFFQMRVTLTSRFTNVNVKFQYSLMNYSNYSEYTF